MKTQLIKTFFLLLTFNLFGQEIIFVKDEILDKYKESGFLASNFVPVGEIDTKYDKQGFWKDYNKIKAFTYISNNGKPQQVTGLFLIYGEGSYNNSEKIGKWIYYTIEDKTFKKIPQKEENYVDGFWDEKFTYFFPNGNIAMTGDNDRKNNEQTIKLYYLSGKVFTNQQYKNNLEIGTHTIFYRDGTVNQITKYNNGKKNGIRQFYHKNGQLWTEEIFNNDLLLNVKFNYDQNGKPQDKGTIKDGNGTVKLYNDTGKLYTIITYKKGKKVSEKNYKNHTISLTK